jgi:hypothetical protein
MASTSRITPLSAGAGVPLRTAGVSPALLFAPYFHACAVSAGGHAAYFENNPAEPSPRELRSSIPSPILRGRNGRGDRRCGPESRPLPAQSPSPKLNPSLLGPRLWAVLRVVFSSCVVSARTRVGGHAAYFGNDHLCDAQDPGDSEKALGPRLPNNGRTKALRPPTRSSVFTHVSAGNPMDRGRQRRSVVASCRMRRPRAAAQGMKT